MSAKDEYNRMCPSSAATVKLGTFLEAVRDALEEIQTASQLTDFAAFKAALDATAETLTALTEDEGDYDLDYN